MPACFIPQRIAWFRGLTPGIIAWTVALILLANTPSVHAAELEKLANCHWVEARRDHAGREIHSVEIVQCLAACDVAPAIKINDELYANITGKRIDEILSELSTRP